MGIGGVGVAAWEGGVAKEAVGGIVAFEVVAVAAESPFQFTLHFFELAFLHVAFVGIFSLCHPLRLQQSATEQLHCQDNAWCKGFGRCMPTGSEAGANRNAQREQVHVSG